jgi:ribosomal protein L37AE/L43A
VIKTDGLRYFNWRQVSNWAWGEVPRDVIKCEDCNRKAVVEMVCPEGYAIYRCKKCQHRFRIVLEYDYFFQEDV